MNKTSEEYANKLTEETKKGGIAQFNVICRTEKCVYNVNRICKCRDVSGKFCIRYSK